MTARFCQFFHSRSHAHAKEACVQQSKTQKCWADTPTVRANAKPPERLQAHSVIFLTNRNNPRDGCATHTVEGVWFGRFNHHLRHTACCCARLLRCIAPRTLSKDAPMCQMYGGQRCSPRKLAAAAGLRSLELCCGEGIADTLPMRTASMVCCIYALHLPQPAAAVSSRHSAPCRAVCC